MSCTTHPNLKVLLDDISPIFGVELQLLEAASNPLESFNISAPKAPKADKVHGLGSLSWIHKSCVSNVVSSVSVDAAECACWGVDILPPPPTPDLFVPRNFFHVYRRSVKEKKTVKWIERSAKRNQDNFT